MLFLTRVSFFLFFSLSRLLSDKTLPFGGEKLPLDRLPRQRVARRLFSENSVAMSCAFLGARRARDDERSKVA